MAGPFKKHLTPLSNKGDIHTHKGKGSAVRDTNSPLSNPFGATMNDYAKQSPTAPPMSTPDQTSDFGD